MGEVDMVNKEILCLEFLKDLGKVSRNFLEKWGTAWEDRELGVRNRDGRAAENSGPASQRPHGPVCPPLRLSCPLVIDMDGSPRAWNIDMDQWEE